MKNSRKQDNSVYYISLFITVAIVAWAILGKVSFTNFANNLLGFLTGNFSWLYLLVMLAFVIFAIWLAFSKYGAIKLGDDDSEPEHSTLSWFAMLFGAGMGIGLVFWGLSEPLAHFTNPPMGLEAGSIAASDYAMRASFTHWGLHPWAAYSIIGLSLAYFQFRKKKPGLISSTLSPLLGDRSDGRIARAVDVLAVFATVAGVATSLGLGTLQINSGLNQVFNLPETKTVQVIIIGIITVIYIWTAISGVDKGIKTLGDINLYLAFTLLGLVIILGPTRAFINNVTNGLGQYVNNFFSDSLQISAFGDNSWLKSYRIFYWAWWIAWAPFVGTFIARISKGRTIREFIAGVILAPSLASIVWFGAFGSMGINLADKVGLAKLAEWAAMPETALFHVYQNYPLGTILSLVTVVLLMTFFVTSANSATFVLGMLTSNGDLNPSNRKKVIWGTLQALLATGLLLSGGLGALQTISIAAAFPFIFIMMAAMVSLVKELKTENLG